MTSEDFLWVNKSIYGFRVKKCYFLEKRERADLGKIYMWHFQGDVITG